MAAQSKVIVTNDESFSDRDFAALEEEDESTAESFIQSLSVRKMISSAWMNTSSDVVSNNLLTWSY